MTADHENPLDNHYWLGCPQLLQLLLFFYDISKTIVFWTNVFLILSDTIAHGNFDWLCFITKKHIETATRLICWVFRAFRAKPLELLDTKNQNDLIETIVRLQKLRALKIKNDLYRPPWIQDILADTLDFVLGTTSRYRRDYGNREEAAGSMPFTKLRTKDRSSLRRLNTAILDEEETTSTLQLICQNCGHPVICSSCIIKNTI